MDDLYFAFSVVFPLFCMMALGYFLRRVKLFTPMFLRQLNSVCFKVFLPLVLFVNVYSSDFKQSFSPRLIIFGICCILVAFTLLMIIIPFIEKENKRRGVLVQAIFRSNYILFGIPITTSLLGEGNVGTTAVMLAFAIPLLNALSVVALKLFSDRKPSILSIIIGVVQNPLIIAAAIAFFFVLTGLNLPAVIEKPVIDISHIATPLALIALGGTFEFSRVGKNLRPLLMGILGRLVVIPLIFFPITLLFGFKGAELIALFAFLVSPTAVSSYTMATNMGGDGELAGQIVVLGSITSIATIFVWILVLQQFIV